MADWPRFRPRRLLHVLVGKGVDFVVVGGIAMVARGSPRFTNDLDICFAPDAANLGVLGTALVELGATLRGVDEDVPFLTLDTREGPIDLLVRPAGSPPYEELRARADRVEVDGVAVLVAGLDDLAAMKRAAGRDQDRIDLETIEAIRRRSG